jgi:hypothetical protein
MLFKEQREAFGKELQTEFHHVTFDGDVTRDEQGHYVSVVDGSLIELAMPELKPYRRVWVYYSHTSTAAGTMAILRFSRGGTELLTLPLWFRKSFGSYHGFAASTQAGSAKSIPGPWSMTWNNSESTISFIIHPMTINTLADRVEIIHTVPFGTARAFIGVLSSNQPLY